ncbi:MAG: methyltransferase domain-containing protein [Ferruginibacter sp.]|nr:methyltransferase domain-containing protein [Cytophagales bacterium]
MSQYQEYPYHSEKPSHIEAYLTKPLLAILEGKQHLKILDVGCGNGWLASRLLGRGFDVYGIDASESGVALANQRHPGRFFVQDLTSDDLPTELGSHAFRVIVSTEVIEHLYNPREYIRFCRAVLQKAGGGDLVISTPYHGYLKNLLLALTGKMDAHFTVRWDGGHIKFWSRQSLSGLLQEEGFTVTGFAGCGRFSYLWKSMIITSST